MAYERRLGDAVMERIKWASEDYKVALDDLETALGGGIVAILNEMAA